MKQKFTPPKKILLAIVLTLLVLQSSAQICISPIITVQPIGLSTCSGNTALFTTVAIGTSLSYQWQVNTGSGFTNCSGPSFSGATTASLSVSASVLS